MTGRYSLCASLTLIALLMIAMPARAADFSFFVGGVMPGTVSFHNVKTSLDNSPVYGFRVGMKLVPHFGLDHTLAFSSDYLFPRSLTDVTEAKGISYNSNLVFNLPVHLKHAVPFVTAGAGFVHQYGDSDLPVGTRFAINYGGGVKFPRIAGPLGVRFDLRGYNVGVVSNKVNMFEVTAGVMLSIGK
jgi:hypothetical protein